MMMNRSLVLIAVLIIIISQSCHKESTPFYSGNQGLFFKNGENAAEVGFGDFREFVKDDTVRIPVYLFGNYLKQASSFILQVDESSTAVAERDYDLPSSFIFKADSIQDTVFIHVLRSLAIYDDTLSLVLRLVPNAIFPAIWQDGDDQAYASVFTIKLSDHIDKPDDWDYVVNYYGPYSDKKLRLLISFCDAESTVSEAINYIIQHSDYWSYILKKYLKEQQSDGTPVYEADGTTLMEAGPDAADN